MSHSNPRGGHAQGENADDYPRGDVLTAEQVAVILQVRPCTVADWARRGIVPSYKIGKFRSYSKRDISDWVSTQRSRRSNSARL